MGWGLPEISFLNSNLLPFVKDAFNMNEQNKANDRREAVSWDMYQQARQDQATAVQTRAKDMIAAGINPLMAAGEGAGAASGSPPVINAPQITGPNPIEALSFMETVKNNEENRKLIRSQRQKTEAETRAIRQDTTMTEPREKVMGGLNEAWDEFKNWVTKPWPWSQNVPQPKLTPPKANPNNPRRQYKAPPTIGYGQNTLYLQPNGSYSPKKPNGKGKNQ